MDTRAGGTTIEKMAKPMVAPNKLPLVLFELIQQTSAIHQGDIASQPEGEHHVHADDQRTALPEMALGRR
jgi:hypothetical protein